MSTTNATFMTARSPWTCPRCLAVNAPHADRCSCAPAPWVPWVPAPWVPAWPQTWRCACGQDVGSLQVHDCQYSSRITWTCAAGTDVTCANACAAWVG